MKKTNVQLITETAAYFNNSGYDTASTMIPSPFDLIAYSGLETWKISCKNGLNELTANKAAEALATEQQKKYKVINHPIVIFVCYGVKGGMPLGATRLLVPKDTTVKGGKHESADKAPIKINTGGAKG
jgi:hypothetical protein